MPLSMIEEQRPVKVLKIGGNQETRRFLETLGFVAGAIVTIVNQMDGNLIINIKDSRIALGREMATKIRVAVE